MTGRRRHLTWLAAVLALSVALVGASSWRGFVRLLQEEPVWTRSIPFHETVQLDGATVIVASTEFGDGEQFDVGRVDDAAQQVLRISSLYAPTQIQEDVEYCSALLNATVNEISARYQARFSSSEVACDGTDLAAQQSEFYFILPKGEVTEAIFYLQVGGETYRWLAVEIR